jgi:NADH:ubiquinone oxidoreductase subunit 5 (subunit L)/multisubunit Na+/H+ antiporter MnhA subunit
MVACYATGALASLFAWRSGRLAIGVGHAAALAGAVVGLGVSLAVLLGGPAQTLTQPLPDLFPFARLSLVIDGLSAYFLLVISSSPSRQPSTVRPICERTRPTRDRRGRRRRCSR